MMFQARQGDVFVRQVPARTPAGTAVGTQSPVILAEGEATGHTHRLTHDELRPIALAPGSYSVTIQREYTPEGISHVAD